MPLLEKMKLYALHGFLGNSTDWTVFSPQDFGVGEIIAPDLFREPVQDFKSWAEDFNQHVSQKSLLMGYSLGGRLALHALLHDPSKWAAAIIISSHPGLESACEKEKRLDGDLEWASRFLHEDWDQIMALWNKQSVFLSDEITPVRRELDYSRNVLAQVLDKLSLARQENLKLLIMNLNIPILWIAGGKDEKYSKIALQMKFTHPQSKLWVAPKSGHRIVWNEKKKFSEVVKRFIRGLT